MDKIWKLITAGPLKGYRTEMAGVGVFLHGLVDWLSGAITLETFGDNVDSMLLGLGIVGARGAIDKVVNAINALSGQKPVEPPKP